MITKDNIKELIQTIKPSDIDAAINGKGDYILLQAHIFNVGAFATIHNMHYDAIAERAAIDSGNLFVDKDSFLQLTSELEVFEY
jgi:hypothetical protein